MGHNDLLATLAIALLWIVLYAANRVLFSFAEVAPWVSLIFLPSGYKMACAAVLRSRSIPGLFIGSVATGFIFLKDFSTVDVLMFSLFSSTLPFVALRVTERIRPLDEDLSNFSLQHVSLLALIYAGLNGVFHFGYRYHVMFFRDVHHFSQLLSMMAGDILGILLFMWLVGRVTRYLLTQLKNKKI